MIAARDVEALFATLFADSHRTLLRGGAAEPMYRPPEWSAPALILYRHDYLASALHETAHWCIAGARRRRLPDYGYWYAEEGRDDAAQAAFEAVEARPQAIEWCFAEAIGAAFRVSLDNPGRGELDPAPFEARVRAERERIAREGLPPRAERFRRALAAASS
ncbi:MAG: elongation factor P hydroxylase [Pseudomonadales bacterium]|jgi:elongation factor P hydroxylase|nr:elongation factor P hydroxylase [Pseudomonadales bacterium]